VKNKANLSPRARKWARAAGLGGHAGEQLCETNPISAEDPGLKRQVSSESCKTNPISATRAPGNARSCKTKPLCPEGLRMGAGGQAGRGRARRGPIAQKRSQFGDRTRRGPSKCQGYLRDQLYKQTQFADRNSRQGRAGDVAARTRCAKQSQFPESGRRDGSGRSRRTRAKVGRGDGYNWLAVSGGCR
jgi:hypothetical protein